MPTIGVMRDVIGSCDVGLARRLQPGDPAPRERVTGDIPIKPAALQNRAGNFVLPGLKGGMAALKDIKLDRNLAGDDPNPAGDDSYPISTLSWILAYEKGNGAKTGAIRQVMQYLLSTAVQNRAAVLGYVPLPGTILSASKKAVARIGE